MQLTPVIAIHMTAALGALVTGPIALWARKGAAQRPRLHRGAERSRDSEMLRESGRQCRRGPS